MPDDVGSECDKPFTLDAEVLGVTRVSTMHVRVENLRQNPFQVRNLARIDQPESITGCYAQIEIENGAHHLAARLRKESTGAPVMVKFPAKLGVTKVSTMHVGVEPQTEPFQGKKPRGIEQPESITWML